MYILRIVECFCVVIYPGQSKFQYFFEKSNKF